MTKPPNEIERANRRMEWANANGLKQYNGRVSCGLRFLDHSLPKDFDNIRFPAEDHATYWKKDGKPYCIVSQPYHVNEEEMKIAVGLATQWGFKIAISAAPAWHYPGGVVHMEWRKSMERTSGTLDEEKRGYGQQREDNTRTFCGLEE